MTSVHEILDVVEYMAVEGRANEGGDALQKFYYELYRPDPYDAKKLIETVDTDTDFDAFAALGMQ